MQERKVRDRGGENVGANISRSRGRTFRSEMFEIAEAKMLERKCWSEMFEIPEANMSARKLRDEGGENVGAKVLGRLGRTFHSEMFAIAEAKMSERRC